ncbi:MAG: conserved phage C-terminal domain-containing protein [Mycoplasmatota bacterium]|nr:conserved phage C-terminal domain-containing protein [Mycoplasmatota bacterium]
MKDNFLLKKSHQEIFNELSKEEAGELIKGIFQYVNTGDSGLNGLLNAVFIPIKKYIDENEKKYQAICERNRQNGANGGRPKKEETQENPMGYDGLENKTQETQVDNLGQNTHISYITNHISHNHKSNNQLSNSNLDIIKNIVSYLNDKTKSKFKYTTKSTQTKINARLNEGYNLNDFIAVIDKKYDEWFGTEFEQYLCPDTLFGTKFEKYLNQKISKANKKTKNDEQWDLLKGVYDGTFKID